MSHAATIGEVGAGAARVRFVKLILLGTLLLAAALLPAHAADPQFPVLAGRVVDEAALLSGEQKARINTDLEALENKTTDQLVVVTLKSLQGLPIEDFGYKLGRHWGIGQAGKDNGVLLVVAPKERKVRIEVGRGLEGTLPDAMAKIIIENAILPRFRAGDYPGGISAGLRDIVAVLTGDAEAVKLRARQGSGQDQIDWVTVVIAVIWLVIFIAVMWSIIRSARQSGKPRSGKKRNSSSGWVFGPGSSSGGWSGGGGFSGGGGGFGGGGASGGW